MPIAVISHPVCQLHDAGEGHPERPDRTLIIQEALSAYPFSFYEAPLATKDQLYRAHDQAYVNWLFSLSPQEGMVGIDADTWMNPYTLSAALRAAGSAILAVDLVMKKEASVVFCNVRPPGHHAEHNKAMGFCFFNNVAVGVMHAFHEYNLERIAIVDFDLHRGNGTQDIFQQDERVLYCSSFADPFYPGYEKSMDNEHILSVPLAPGTDGKIFCRKVSDAWFEKLRDFKPQLIFFSAGFDAHMDDPMHGLNLQKKDYVWLTDEVVKIARECCEGKVVSVLEGGYHLGVLAECVPAHVNALK